MDIIQATIVNKPIADCWEVLGNQYTEIHKWASPVNHSKGDNKVGLNGASCDIRGCDVDGMGSITEKLIEFSPEEHFLSYEIITGLPNIMQAGRNSWRLIAISPNQTRVDMKGVIELKGILGKIMQPMVKIQFGKMTKKLVEEFKYYVENGRPHPRKIKATIK